jgi:hypothetical protein
MGGTMVWSIDLDNGLASIPALPQTMNGYCGPLHNNTVCGNWATGGCCSAYGSCGSSSDYCDVGCQSGNCTPSPEIVHSQDSTTASGGVRGVDASRLALVVGLAITVGMTMW